MKLSKKIKYRLLATAIALMVTVFALGTATFAWYVFQTNARTTSVHMSVGTDVALKISNAYDGTYASSAVLDEFVGRLNPVSTDRILGGFQKVEGFTNGSENQSMLVANLFGASDAQDYYKTALYLTTNGIKQNVYLSNIGYEDSDEENPISTAIRVGFVVHEPGENKPVANEYIFEINKAANPDGVYNTATGEQGYVLDSTKTDGTTIPFANLLGPDNYVDYDVFDSAVTLRENSVPLFMLDGNGIAYCDPVQVDVYIWLEGCDMDCYNNICNQTLKKISLSFACSMASEEG